MEPERFFNREESLRVFREARTLALMDAHLLVPVQRLRFTGEVRDVLVKHWLGENWIRELATPSCYQLTNRSLAYAPDEVRIMTTTEKNRNVRAAMKCIDAHGIIKVSEFVKLASREALYRLIDAGIVVRQGHKGDRKYKLLDHYRY